jgi:hypothetical protein
MHIKAPLPNIFGGLTRHQPPLNEAALGEPCPDQAAVLTLSMRSRLLLPVTIFVVSLLSIAFSHFSNFVGTLWPSNAIVLVALLRHERNASNYASIMLAGGVGIGLAALVTGNSPALSTILAAANVF